MDSNTNVIAVGTTTGASVGSANARSASAAGTASTAVAATTTAKAVTAASAQPGKSTEPQRDPRSLQFQVQDNRVVTTIIDQNNKTVVVQIPDAEMIQLAKSIDRMQGFLVQEKA
jgi:flagellar protein FlaG